MVMQWVFKDQAQACAAHLIKLLTLNWCVQLPKSRESAAESALRMKKMLKVGILSSLLANALVP